MSNAALMRFRLPGSCIGIIATGRPATLKSASAGYARRGYCEASSFSELQNQLAVKDIQRRPLPSMNSGFVDHVRLRVSAGNGGPGIVSFRRGPNAEAVPADGGNGGAGGAVWLKADADMNSLKFSVRHIRADSGGSGGCALRNGRSGSDVVVPVPPGTVVRLAEVENSGVLCDLSHDGAKALVAKGGLGGRGNASYKSSRNRSPQFSQPGTCGESFLLDLELKSIADIGLVGLPNAGKSTLLRAVSRAKPKVASYPFTTLRPHIGVVTEPGTKDRDPRRVTVADIPGLIEGAHVNKGLGHEFLRHVERTFVLVYVIDMSSDVRGRSALDVLMQELELYEAGLTKRPACVAANKMDVGMNSVDSLHRFIHEVGDFIPVFPVSAKDGTGVAPLVLHLIDLVQSVRDAKSPS